jgi:hypothetical protein
VLLFALAGTTFGLTQYLQLVLGYSPLVAGLGTLPVAVAIGLTAPVAPQLAARVGPGAAVAAGLPLMSTGRTAMAVLTTTDSYARCSSAGCSPPSTAPTSRAMCRGAEAVGQGVTRGDPFGRSCAESSRERATEGADTAIRMCQGPRHVRAAPHMDGTGGMSASRSCRKAVTSARAELVG